MVSYCFPSCSVTAFAPGQLHLPLLLSYCIPTRSVTASLPGQLLLLHLVSYCFPSWSVTASPPGQLLLPLLVSYCFPSWSVTACFPSWTDTAPPQDFTASPPGQLLFCNPVQNFQTFCSCNNFIFSIDRSICYSYLQAASVLLPISLDSVQNAIQFGWDSILTAS